MDPAEITFQSIRVATESGGGAEGRLVLAGGTLIGVLVLLSAESHNPHAGPAGTWCLDAGFGPCAGVDKTFSSLEEARQWIARHADAPHVARLG